MKKISMLALASAITLSACAQQKEGDFTIEGTLPDTVRTVMVYADGTKENTGQDSDDFAQRQPELKFAVVFTA